MVRKAEVEDRLYMDEAEGFLLEHALFSPPRSWPPLPPPREDDDLPAGYIPPHPPARTQSDRLATSRRKMDWDTEMATHPDEPVEIPVPARTKSEEDDANSERCVICLMALRDRTIVGVCGHEFCFECIGVWANQSRRCPLCSTDMAPFLLHDLDNATPTKFYLPPLPSRKVPSLSLPGPSNRNRRMSLTRAEKEERDELEEQIDRRREVYQHELYCKHIASNTTSNFRPNPTPRQIAEEPAQVQRATAFLRRELRVWSLVDVDFLTSYILSLLKAIDVRSEPFVRLIADFLETPTGPGYPHAAEHFAHELYCFIRSPYKELVRWDAVAQYDPVPEPRGRSASPISKRPTSVERLPSRSPRGRLPSSSRSGSRSPAPAPAHIARSPRSLSPSRSPSRSRSRSPRDWSHRDTFVAPPSPGARRWNETDTWLDPEYAAWLEDERRREGDRLARRRSVREEDARRHAPRDVRGKEEQRVERVGRVELLPSPPAAPLRMDETSEEAMDLDEVDTRIGAAVISPLSHGLSIRGAAKEVEPRRLSLLERLAKAKAEAAGSTSKGTTASAAPPPAALVTASGIVSTIIPPTAAEVSGGDVSQPPHLRHHFRDESKAQELRRLLLEAKARRQAAETDATLRKMDRLERKAEVRRRLMVLKMMAAETEGERKQRELKEKLLGEKRRRMLRDLLLARKRESKGGAGQVVEIGKTEAIPTVAASAVAVA
ncbi:hypothetical protein EHS25_004066 [Saitozyma podzolica]|uniref:RING-type E3 ubiquitin transferase n=1 Tax=Saitozyma podzolica TaxID=1890683 RepID=A0A427YSZ7_9TREE|nr:hypothetical protein EHS25_004066 [Saitozyma podzolica]